MKRELGGFMKRYRKEKTPWEEVGGYNMWELWIVHVAYFMAEQEYDMREYIRQQNGLAPEPMYEI